MDKIDKPWRNQIGGMWDEIGELQFNFLLTNGLKPEHKLLDVGCGCFRGGIHFIKYLQDGNYCGIDRSRELLDAGIDELRSAGLESKVTNITCDTDFRFDQFSTKFDFMLAQSVFTHLPLNSIQKCLYNASMVLKPGGRFYATFFEDPGGTNIATPIVHDRGGITTYSDKDPFHYQFKDLGHLGDKFNLNTHYIGDWDHPRDQKIIYFTLSGD
jgi:ubiquinone/menaquinone biosynthesis C-methylase UbiE